MYMKRTFTAGRIVSTPRQAGVVLLVALVMLVALTLAGIALVRSVYTTNLISGNMAFQQSAMHSADAGNETAIAWLQANNSGATLYSNVSGTTKYYASRQDPPSSQSWDEFWNEVLVPAGMVNTLATDTATGNTISYVIQRLCQGAGDPASNVGCVYAPSSNTAQGNSKGAGVQSPTGIGAVYYRITTRVDGPRGTVSYVQSIVSM